MKIFCCRSCKSKKLEKIFNLGKQYFTGIFPSKKNNKVPIGNLTMIKCKNCDLLQLQDNFDQNQWLLGNVLLLPIHSFLCSKSCLINSTALAI